MATAIRNGHGGRGIPRAALLLAVALTGQLSCRSVQRPKNIVLISIDTLRADHLGCYGYAKPTSPAMDRLAESSTVFDNAFTPVPLTLPAHLSMLTGLYPTRTGVRDNGFFRAPESLDLLPEALAGNGFVAGGFVSGFPLNRRFGLNQGFQLYDDRCESYSGSAFTYLERSADATVTEAIRWIASRQGRFFLFLHLFDPHAPYRPHTEYSELTGYDGEIRAADAAVGRLVDTLRSRALLEQTLLIVTGDHGESLGEHGEKTHGIFLYDSTLHVPLIIRGGPFRAGMRDQRLVSLVDIFPTVLAAVGLKVGGQKDGFDLAQEPARDTLYAESFYPRFDLGWSELRAVRSSSEKLVEAPTPELYDLLADPDELHNVYASRRERADRLTRVLARIVITETSLKPIRPDASTSAALRALGYVQGGGDEGGVPLPDPKDRVRLLGIIDEATSLADSGAADRAAALLAPEVESDAGNPELAALYAECLGRSGQTARLADFLSSAARLRYPRLLIALAKTLVDRGDAAHARELLRDALTAGGDEAQIANETGISYAVEGRAKEAEVELRRSAALDPNFRDAWINLGHLLNQSGDAQAATECYRRALALGEPTSSLLNGAGIAAMKAGDLAGAETQLRAAFGLDPGSPEVHLNLARVLLARQRAAEALDLLSDLPSDLPAPLAQAVQALRQQALAETSKSPGAAKSR